MKKVLINSSLSGLLLTFTQVAHAHTGHDHAHWTSEPLHLLTIAAVVAVVVAGLAYKKIIRNNKNVSTTGE